MPAFTLFKILSANIADCKDFVQAVYCTLKIVAQYDPEKNETKYHQDYMKDDNSDTDDGDETKFFNFEGDQIDSLINCTAPSQFRKAWISRAITDETLEKGLYVWIDPSGDRFHEINKYMGSVNLNYRFFMRNDLVDFINEDTKELEIVPFVEDCIVKAKNFLKCNLKRMALCDYQIESEAAGKKMKRASQIAKKALE